MIVVDVETSGPYPGKYGLLSIGALEFENPTNDFYVECRLDEETEIDPIALKINGFSKKEARDLAKMTETEATQKLLDWAQPIEDRTLGGHNTYFDAGFLRTATNKLKKNPKDRIWIFGRRYVDTHSLAYTEMKRRGWQIPALYGFSALWSGAINTLVGLPEEPDPHHALVGAKMEAEAMSRLIYGKGLLKEYSKWRIPNYLKLRIPNFRPPKIPLVPYPEYLKSKNLD